MIVCCFVLVILKMSPYRRSWDILAPIKIPEGIVGRLRIIRSVVVHQDTVVRVGWVSKFNILFCIPTLVIPEEGNSDKFLPSLIVHLIFCIVNCSIVFFS